MSRTIMFLDGSDGQVELMTDRVIIHRNGIFNAVKYGFNSRREIPLGAISEVVYKPAGLSLGQLEFVRSGRSTDDKKNANAVHFGRKKNQEFEVFKEKVFELINQLNSQKK